MSVLIYTENAEGKFKKSTFEAISYARAIADQTNTNLVAISIGDVADDQLNLIGKYGADKVLTVSNAQLKNFVNQAYASVIASAAKKEGVDVVVLSNSFSGRGLAPRIGVKLEAGVAEPKIPNMRGIMSARTKPLNVVEAAEVKNNSEILTYETPAPRGQVKLVAANEAEKLIGLLHTEAKVI